MRFFALATLVIAVLASGCGSHHSVLDQGVRVGPRGGLHRIRPTQAVAAVQQARAEWERELASRARAHPQQTFANLPEPVLRDRLAAFARRYDFEVTSLRLRRPRQLAPDIVVRTSHYLELAHALPSILKQLDPKLRTNDDRTGWRFEGFFLTRTTSTASRLPPSSTSGAVQAEAAGSSRAATRSFRSRTSRRQATGGSAPGRSASSSSARSPLRPQARSSPVPRRRTRSLPRRARRP